MGTSSPSDRDSGVLLDTTSLGAGARHVARERQRKELRRERDAVVLSLAKEIGEQALAERLGVTRPVVDKLLADARAREIKTGSGPTEPQITLRRLRGANVADLDRWAELDAHYETLGGGSSFKARRRNSRPT